VSQPEAGINTAKVSVYEMITDCMARGLTPKSWAIVGRAVLTIVASSVSMKKPMATNHNKVFLEKLSFMGLD